jgi:hypothetical protein
MMLHHHHFEEFGFIGDNVNGYTNGSVIITIIEDEDCKDRFFAGEIRIRTLKDLTELLENEQGKKD